jgi:hypothetical protein
VRASPDSAYFEMLVMFMKILGIMDREWVDSCFGVLVADFLTLFTKRDTWLLKC